MKNIYKAFAEFQKTLPVINKDKEGYGYRYASFDNIVATVTPLLSQVGLAYYHTIVDGKMVCVLVHAESGETMESSIPMVSIQGKGMNEAQALGATTTYLRRYTLTSILGVATEEDTDTGNIPAEKAQVKSKPWLNLTNQDGSITDQGDKMIQYIGTHGVEAALKLAKKKYKVSKQAEDWIRAIGTQQEEETEKIVNEIFAEEL